MPTTIFTNDFLNIKRTRGDHSADELISAVFTDDHRSSFREWLASVQLNDDLLKRPAPIAGFDVIEKARELPPGANLKLMKAGNAFFARHAGLILNLMGLLSLPYCYAAADGSMVLYLSTRMKDDTGRRLLETADFIWDVMAPDAFEPGAKGFASILKVRLMHAAGRYYTLNGGAWNMSWGYPINQEDMAGTNLSFSLIVIRGLRKFGLSVSYAEQQAFMHLWNVIGYLMGVDQDLLPDEGAKASDLEEAIRIRHFRPSEQGQALTAALTGYITSIDSGSTNSAVTPANVLQLMRYVLGDDIADILSIKKVPISAADVRLLKLATGVGDLRGPGKPDVAKLYDEAYQKFKKISSQAALALAFPV